MSNSFTIAGRPIGPNHRPYVVAEMSGNHNGDLSRALALLDAAKAAGADALKLQTYRADTITIDHDGPEFFVRGGLWDGRRLFELYEEAHTPWEWHAALFERGRQIGLTVFSAPFDPTAVDLLESLGAPAYKIASPEIIDLDLVGRVARTGKPLIMSTGMATFEEIGDAVDVARREGSGAIVLLHCTSAYPTPPEAANLATIPELARRFGTQVGLSDHTLETTAAVAAIGLGAVLIEKHVTLARADGGVDSAFSLEPAELARLCRDVAFAAACIGTVVDGPTPAEAGNLKNRRSLYCVREMRAGEVFTREHIRSIRPAAGLPPKHLDTILGRRARADIPFGTPLAWDLVDES